MTNGTSNRYALLIGIDCYLPNRLLEGGYYPSLNGCVRDISLVEDFLKQKIGLIEENILKLTSTNDNSGKPPELKDKWPTYENMVAAFGKITDLAQPKDQVYIHYAGHGGRTKTLIPQLKGKDGLDETLVPIDIGNSEARYLRDIEISHLLKKMVDKELIVTVVLDSCHSGGATRGRNLKSAVRGLGIVDTTPRPTESLVASHEKLAATWQSLASRTQRNVNSGSGWLPEAKGYVLLAACRDSESAHEDIFEGNEANGALTYWMLKSLRDIGPGITYKMLHDRVIANVHSLYENQTPVLEGDGNRIVFGSDHVKAHYAVTVMNIENNKVLLNAGQAHGLRKDAQFAIYPAGNVEFTQMEKRIALAKIIKPGATDSWAELTMLRQATIEKGVQAVLLDPGSVKLVRKVHIVDDRADLPSGFNQKAALEAVKEALKGIGWVEIAGEGEAAEYQVALNKNGEYEIWDRTGKPIANLSPPLKFGDPKEASGVAHRLVHLAKYHAVRQLDNCDSMSPIAHKLEVELIGVQKEYDPVDAPEPRPFDDMKAPNLNDGEWMFLRIKNNLKPGLDPNDPLRILNITVLDLQPDWGISQIHPSGSELFEPLDPGQERVLPLHAYLPERYMEGTDVIKVFATIGTTNFRWLELPSLDQPISRSAGLRRAPKDSLEELLAAVLEDKPKKRNLDPAEYPSKTWITTQVEVKVKRPG